MTTSEKPHLHPRWINYHATKVVTALQKKGYTTYIVGGCVRDLLVGIIPKDFDLVTNARPRQIKKSVSNAFIIGRRFRLVLVKRGELQIEVATFRRNKNETDIDEFDDDGELILVGDNYFGTPKEDAKRRDFTINSLLYDPSSGEVIDHLGGLEDLKQRLIKIIGDGKTRIEEDSIRIFRAIRLAHKLNFSIEPKFKKIIADNAQVIETSVLPRRREEILKLLKLKNPSAGFLEAKDLGILKYICPTLDKALENNDFVLRLREKPEVLNHKSTLQLFSFLIWAYYRSMIEADPNKKTKSNIDEIPELRNLMKDELGMFNYEQSISCRALKQQAELPEIASLKADKINFHIKKNCFPLALMYSKMDLQLSATELTKLQKYVVNER